MAGVDSYRAELRASVRGLWSGVLDAPQFFEGMRTIINRRLAQAFLEGARECGVLSEEEYTPAEFLALGSAVQAELAHVQGFAADINRNSKAAGGKLTPLLNRVEKWLPRYRELRNLGKQLACGDQKLEWVVNPTKENCHSCQRLNGQVRRASFWQERDVRPFSPQLECMISSGGVPVCGCEFRPTRAPLSRGPLPRLP